jgi:rod shape-determining protein MreD
MIMRSILVSIPVLGLALILQTTIVGRMTLLSGSADLILLVLAAWSLQERVRNAGYWAVTATILVGAISGVPWIVYLIGFLVTVALGRMLTRRVWQAPLLAMFFVTLIGTMVLQMTTFIVLTLSQVPLPLGDSLAKVVLPSILLNMLLAIPVHTLMRDLASRLYPSEVEA